MKNSSLFSSDISAPRAEIRPVTETHHGITRTDDYAWLRASNWQEVLKNPSMLPDDIRTHLEAENAYQESLMSDTVSLQETVFQEIRGRIKEDDSGVPLKHGPFAYGYSYQTGGQHPRYFRTGRDGGEQSILLDGDAEAQGHKYFQLGSAKHSPDHRHLMWAFDNKGSELYTLRVRDLETGLDGPDSVPNAESSGGSWTEDGSAFVYVAKDENHRSSKAMLHRLGTPVADDVLLYEEADPVFSVHVYQTDDRRRIVIGAHSHETAECRIVSSAAPTEPLTLVAARQVGRKYEVESGDDVLFILTNADGATDFKIVAAPAADPGPENWTDVVPHERGRLILSFRVFADFVVWRERRDGLARVVVRHRETGSEHVVVGLDGEEFGCFNGLWSCEYDTEMIQCSFSSMRTPTVTLDHNMRTRERLILKTQTVPSGHDPNDYVTRRLAAPADDGELVPVSLLYRSDTCLDGSAPCYLNGYGSYGIVVEAQFDIQLLSLADRGFVVALAHIRGGRDKGHSWYTDTKREHKTRTFRDFVAVANHLVAQGITSHHRIVARGASAGGLLMGAVANEAPGAFGAIIAQVPFVDVLATMLDESLPLTPSDRPEWGDPIASEDDYRTIAAYSPIDNIVAQAYPPILATTGLTDKSVCYWEAAKWVARLRELKTNDSPVLLRTNMSAGHSGASGRFSWRREVAFVLAFAIKAVGSAIG
ncbi:oligopeptidase B [Lasiosphaeris hirsuta]|uniref:Prolyl endopeptidase n=1 Tax=Lasiosphaeris hirsuta TaxID=260670 RepID=A0AA40AYK3_9PEZI|nr:oligopeptidase B [Lasiosphaeris hirsuta]